MGKLLLVSEVARSLGRSINWLSKAERKGKIPDAKRDLNNWRAYTEEDIEKLRQLLVSRLVTAAESSKT